MRLATEVRETENLFETLTNKSPVGLYIVQDGRFCYTNPTFQSTTGYEEDELLGRDALGLVVPEDREQVRENALRMLKGERTLPYQFRVTHKNGSIKWITESVASIQYRGRRATLGDFIDITAHKRVEETLQAERNKLQSLVDVMEDGLTIQDKDYNIIFQNELAKINSGGDHVGEKCYRAYERRESICEDCPLEKAFKDGETHTVERQQVLPSGEIAFFENTANPIRDVSGEIVACLEIGRNVTERKQAEETLRRTAEDLQFVALINDAANQGYSLQRIIKLLVQETKKMFSCYGATFYSISEDKKYLIMENFTLPRAVTSRIEQLTGAKIPAVRIRLQEGSLYLKSLQEGKPHLINDRETIYGLIAECTENKLLKKLAPRIYKLLKLDSVMQVPLVAEGEITGMVDISRRQPFTELELERFAIIAQQLLFTIKQKGVGEALQAERNKLQSLIDTMEDQLTIRDRDYNLIYMAEHVKKLWGDRTGEKCYRVLEGQDKVCDGCPAEKVFRDGKSHASERRVVIPSGEVLFWETRANPIRDTGGRIVSCLEIARDITERKQMDEKLKLLSSVTEQVADATIITAADFNITYVNKAAQDLFGYSLEEMLGKHIKALNAEPLPKSLEQELEQTISSGKLWSGTLIKKRKDSSTFLCECHITPLHDNEGKISSYIDVMRDITERKQAEDKLQHLNLVLLAIRNINKLIARSTDRDSLLKGACANFVETRGYYSAWIALLDESGKLVTTAEAGLGKSFLQLMERLKRGELTHCGCKALEKPGVLWIEDVASECEGCPLVKEKTGRGAMSVRLECGGKVYGLMTVSIPPGIAAEKEEHDLLEEIAGDIAFALHSMEQKQERKRAEEALRTSEEMYKTVVEDAPVGIYYNDFRGTFLYGNKKAEEIVDHKMEELLGKNFLKLKLLGPEGIAKAAKLLALNKLGKATGPDLFTLNRKDGTTGIVEIRTKVSTFGGKKAVLGMVEDISERKKAEEELSKAQTQLSGAVQMAHLGPWEYDAVKDLFTFNDAFYKLFHTTAEEVGGYTMASAEYARRFVHPEDAYLVGEEVRKALQADDPNFSRQLDHRIIYADGKVGYISVRFFIIKDETGRTVKTYGVNQDITEHKRAEEALQAEKNKLQSLIGAMEETITIQDTEYNIIYQNEPSRIASGGGHLGEKCYRAYEGRESICEGCPVEKAFQDGKSHASERETTISGEAAFWENTASPIRDAEGRIVSCLELARDITERKKQEQALADELTQRRLLIDKSLDGIVVLDEDAKVVEANQRFAEMLGYTLKEVHNLHTWDWDRAFSPEEILEMGRNVDEKGLRLETKHTRKDGSVFDVDISISGIMCGGRKLIFCIDRDITERKRAKDVLQAERNKLQSLIDAIEDDISIQDRDYNIIYQNEPSKISSGGDHLGEKCHRAYEGREGICEDCPVEKAFKNGKPHTSERQRVLPSGKVSFWENTANPIRDAKGRVISCLEVGRNITERRNQEQALADELTRRRLLIDQSADGIVVIDENDKVYEANQRFADMLGYTFEEAHELHTWDWDKNYSREQIHDLGRKADEKGYLLETTHTRKDGSAIDVDISINASMFGGHKLIFCVCRDVTERKKAEQALADELTRRRLLIDQSLDGIVVLDEDAKVVEANQSFAEMLGYTLEEVRELHTWDWDKNFPPKKILEMGRHVDEKGLHLETKHTRKDGSVIDVDISINGTMCSGQKLIFCVCRDITERKKMEEALTLAAEEWRGTFDSITDAISIHDRDFRIQRANKAFADIFHMRPEQIIGRHCYELHKGGKPISGCPHKQTLATGKPAAAEFYESHLGKYLLESTSPIFDDKGEVVGTIHIARDITEQKQQNERLMMADRLVSIGELAAGTAHELNNPLTSVLGFTQLIMEKDIPDDISEDLKLIHNEAQRAANVTKNLLTFGRRHTPTKQLNQINNIIEDVLKLRAYEQKVNSIEVQRQLASNLPEIKVDYFQMQQVFLNIIINAEHFMIEAHNRGTLTITTKKRNDNVRISIADDGPGIPPENLSRIFNPFFTTKAAGKGTGLGLSICHGIVAEHGGQIYVKSQPDKGTTIVVELPVNVH